MLFVMGIDHWRTEADWPLPDTQYRPYYLHSAGQANTLHGDGTLSAEPPGDEPPDVYLYNPLRPVPTVGGQVILPGGNADGAARPARGRGARRRAGVQHAGAGPAGRGDRPDRAAPVRGVVGARHRLHGQAGRCVSGWAGDDPDRGHPARALPRLVHDGPELLEPERSTSCGSTCGRRRTSFCRAIASGWRCRAATSHGSTATATRAGRSRAKRPSSTSRRSIASSMTRRIRRA